MTVHFVGRVQKVRHVVDSLAVLPTDEYSAGTAVLPIITVGKLVLYQAACLPDLKTQTDVSRGFGTNPYS